mmetsp:Transcript_37550/g.40750  ORF Transcript_37550/g.40750 Transcript_37550/m.40750 type:complete len:95 (-) Transcript_37550:242-526(-)
MEKDQEASHSVIVIEGDNLRKRIRKHPTLSWSWALSLSPRKKLLLSLSLSPGTKRGDAAAATKGEREREHRPLLHQQSKGTGMVRVRSGSEEWE